MLFDFIKAKKDKILCPYCNMVLEEPPKTKKKCPFCKNPVYFKKDPYTNKQYYLTETKAVDMDRVQDSFRIEEKFFNTFKTYELSERHFKKCQTANYKKGEYSPFTFIASIFDELKIFYEKRKDYQNLSSLYYSMAFFLHEFNLDRGYNHDTFPLLYESRKMYLMYCKNLEKQLGFKQRVQILTYGKGYACDKCSEQEGKKYTIDEALEKMPIPVKNCVNGFCFCFYVEVL